MLIKNKAIMDISNIKRIVELNTKLEVLNKLLSDRYEKGMWICYSSICFNELLGEELWNTLKERVISAIKQEKEQIEKEIEAL